MKKFRETKSIFLKLLFMANSEYRICWFPGLEHVSVQLEKDGSAPELAALRRDRQAQGVAVVGRSTLLSHAGYLTNKRKSNSVKKEA